MATKQPTSQRLKVEQYVLCIERATIILFFIWFFAIEYLINHKTFSEKMMFVTISICFLVFLYSLEQSESEILENINFSLGIRGADDEYADLHQRSKGSYKGLLFWFERLAISSFFIMFFQVETSALTIGVAAATTGVFFCCNLMYFHCFLESESEAQQEFGKEEEEEEEYYEMKLKRKKEKWERKLKKIRDVYREDLSKWEEDNRNLAAKLLTATATSDLYRALMRDIHSSF